MTPRFSIRRLSATHPRDYVIRFVFGGLVAVFAMWVGQRYGPDVGGLFLAFPALLPASLTLVNEQDGRASAYDDARGAIIGSVALGAFALLVWKLAGSWSSFVVLTTAMVIWVVLAVILWRVFLGR